MIPALQSAEFAVALTFLFYKRFSSLMVESGEVRSSWLLLMMRSWKDTSVLYAAQRVH